MEDSLSAEENLTQKKQLQDVLNHMKSDLEDWTAKEQQLQPEEIEAEQQLRTEQDKFTVLETQLDELGRSMGNAAEQLRSPRH
jgi:chromosome segregation ATPase